jgi:hypothetical protein
MGFTDSLNLEYPICYTHVTLYFSLSLSTSSMCGWFYYFPCRLWETLYFQNWAFVLPFTILCTYRSHYVYFLNFADDFINILALREDSWFPKVKPFYFLHYFVYFPLLVCVFSIAIVCTPCSHCMYFREQKLCTLRKRIWTSRSLVVYWVGWVVVHPAAVTSNKSSVP